MISSPAIAVLEFMSIARGTHAADAMVKKAPIDTFRIGTVQPGKYLVLLGGSVAAVAEARTEGLRLGGEAISDEIFLPDVHPQVAAAIEGVRQTNTGDALGILETCAIPTNVAAADRAVKTTKVTIIEIRLGNGLGGKAITHLAGTIHDVQAALEAGIEVAARRGVTMHHALIPIQHEELRECVGRTTEFFTG